MLLDKIGLQLYSLREETPKDFCGTVEKVAKMGYTGVEFAGYGGLKPVEMAKLLADNGLTAYSTHCGGFPKTDAEMDAEIEMALAVGYKYLVCPGQPMKTHDEALHFADVLNEAAAKLRPHGLRLGYHNHAHEFKKQDGKIILQHIAEAFPADKLGFTLDTYWVQAGGGDPAYWIEQLKGRLPCIHLKDYAFDGDKKMAVVGEGNINFDRVFEKAEAAGVKYMLVEQDNCNGEDPFDCLARSYKFLKSKGF